MKLIAFFSTLVTLLIGFSYLFIDPNFFYYKNVFNGIAFSHRAFVSAFYALLIVGFFLAYVCILHEVKKKRLGIRKISVLLAISFLIILSYPTVLSYDIFNYILFDTN